MQSSSVKEKEFRFLRDTLTSLEETAGRVARPAIANLSHRLDSWAARAAIVGQVGSGKSSILNALLGEVDFLPTDVNPTTSAITNIRINIAADPMSGGRFDFFDPKSWDDITNGAADIRELTKILRAEHAFPAKSDQGENLKLELQRRVGQRFEELLGTSHEYATLTREILQGYVCAGPMDGEPADDETQGRFANLTQEAHIYLKNPDFGFPLILTDAPGESDLHQVRKCLYRKTIDHADLHVMVLSAHQSLSKAEFALIETLAGQPGKETVLFINRLDELDEFDVECSEIVNRTRDQLQKALPGANLPIHVGSAYFAQLALRIDDEAGAARDQLDDERLARYLSTSKGWVPENQRERFMLASGVRDLRQAFAENFDRGASATRMNEVLECIRAETSALISATNSERNSLQTQIDQVRRSQLDSAFETIEEELEDLKELRKILETILSNFSKQTEQNILKTKDDLQPAMEASVRAFIEDPLGPFSEKLFRAQHAHNAINEIEIGLAPVRRQFEADVKKQYGRFRVAMDVQFSDCHHACFHLAETQFDLSTPRASLSSLPSEDFSSIMTSLNQSVLVGLICSKSWGIWRKPETDTKNTLNALRDIAKAELSAQSQEIMEAFDRAQNERASSAKDRLLTIIRIIDNAITERSKRYRVETAKKANSNLDAKSIKRMIHQLETHKELLDHRLCALSDVESTLPNTVLADAA